MTNEELENGFCKHYDFNCIKCPYGDKYGKDRTWCRVSDDSIINTKNGKKIDKRR